jgi:simple sugar transport system permease protein
MSFLQKFKTTFAFILVMLITSLFVYLMKESPIHFFKVLMQSAFGNAENFSYTLYFTTPYLLTGASVYFALKAGLFNIGAEGQLYLGAVGAIVFGNFISQKFLLNIKTLNPFFFFIILLGGFFFSFLFGGLWGLIAGYLKTKRGVHEVIATIMLNFIAYAFTNWIIVGPLKNPNSQHPETVWIHQSLQVEKFWEQLSYGFFIAIIVALIVFFIIKKTWWGFRIRAVGENELASRLSGIDSHQTIMQAFFVSGGIAGLVGFCEIFLNHYRLIDSFSSGFGFTGLAIALLTQNSLLRFFLASFLFGALFKGSLDLDIETETITRELSLVIQALILIALSVVTNSKNKAR